MNVHVAGSGPLARRLVEALRRDGHELAAAHAEVGIDLGGAGIEAARVVLVRRAEDPDGREREARVRASGRPWTIVRSAPVALGTWLTRLAARVADGGPVLLRDDDRSVFRLVGPGDLVRGIALFCSRSELAGRTLGLAGDEVWTAESLVRALAAGRHVEVLRLDAQARRHARELGVPVPRVAPRGRPVRCAALPALGWSPGPADEWLPGVLARAALRPAEPGRLREIALAAHARRASAGRGATP